MANKPSEIVQMAINTGQYKAKLSFDNYLIRGFMAGLLIAVGGALATVCATGIGIPGIKQLVLGSVFPVGLIAIVLTGMSLFTGDAMLLPISAMHKQITWKRVFYAWTVVYIANFLGSLFWAYLMSVGPFSKGGSAELTAFGANAIAISEAKVNAYVANGGAGWWSAFMKGIACNLLVNMAILLAISSKSMIGKFFGIWFPIMAFVASGFEHSVANMYFIPAGIFCGADVTWGNFLFYNLFPVTIGNIIGGFLFIGVVYYHCFKKELECK
ncbi:MAG TPA: formate/nitrite transporter family protein [Bacteroidales bacterium]|nr:formate/nitrite transporter family protein [Bacteroidales bacterium]